MTDYLYVLGHTDYLYVLGHPDGFCKIGRTINLERRFATLDCASPYKLIPFFACAPNERVHRLEHMVHCALFDEHEKQEWFRATPERVVDVIKDCAKRRNIELSELQQPFRIRPRQRYKERLKKHVPYRIAGYGSDQDNGDKAA